MKLSHYESPESNTKELPRLLVLTHLHVLVQNKLSVPIFRPRSFELSRKSHVPEFPIFHLAIKCQGQP